MDIDAAPLFEPGSTAHVAGWFHGLKSARPGGPFHDRKEGLHRDIRQFMPCPTMACSPTWPLLLGQHGCYCQRYFFGLSFESRDASAAIRRFASRKFSGLQSSAISTMSSAKQWH
jgi:hypothetical protein